MTKVRESTYYISGAVLYILGLVQVWTAVKGGGDIAAAVQGLGTLIAGTAPAYAGYKVGEQRKDGLFDEVAPVDAVVTGVQQIIESKAKAEKEIEAVKAAVSQATSDIPVVGPLVSLGLNQLK